MNAPPSGVASLGRGFSLLLLGETANMFGLALLQFALGVWVYERSGSPQQFAGLFLAMNICALVVLPWAGALADRLDRRWVILCSDIVVLLLTSALGLLLRERALAVGHLYVFMAVVALVASVKGPAYQAAVGALVPHGQMTRAGALIGFSMASSAVLAPLSGGLLAARFGAGAVILLQPPLMIAGMLAVFSAFSQSRPNPRVSPAPTAFSFAGLLKGTIDGMMPALSFLRREPMMRLLLVYTVVHDGLLALASVMATPLILAAHSSSVLGLLNSFGVIGGMVGSAVLAVLNTTRRITFWLLTFNLCLSLSVLIVGFQPSVPAWCACQFVGMFAGACSGNCATALWMRKVPNATQGSLFSLLSASRLVVSSMVMALGGALGEHLLRSPTHDGGFGGIVARWVGEGQVHALGLLFVGIGGLGAVVSLVALGRSSLRRLDELVSDAPQGVGAP